jgi:hypothetical protein
MRVLAAFLFSLSALACVEVPPEYTVPPVFSVRVTNGYGAVAGLKLQVTRFKMTEFLSLNAEQQRAAKPDKFTVLVAESVTDSSGEAHFNLSTPGDFDVHPDIPAHNLFWITVHVRTNAQPATVRLEWPTSVLQTKQLRGRISDGLMSSHTTPLKARVSVHQLVSFEEVAATTTANDGSFQFPDAPSGLYFVRVEVTNESSRMGDIPIFVGQEATREMVSIEVGFTDCGLSYDLEENAARHKPVACFNGGKPVQCD